MKRLLSTCLVWALVLSLAPPAASAMGESARGATAAVASPVPAARPGLGMLAAAPVPDKDFDSLADAGNTDPQGIWSDGTTLWVADSDDGKVYAYDHATRQRDADNDFDSSDLDTDNTEPYGIWSDGAHLWVVDGDAGSPKIYAYDLSTKARVPSQDFNSLQTAGNTVPTGLWADSATMWVADEQDAKVYAYNRSTRQRDSAKDINTLRANDHTSPTGMWSDGATIWVSDVSNFLRTSANTAYAYELASGQRRPDHDVVFPILDAWLLAGLWSDGTTLWAASSWDEKIYATTLPEPPAAPTGLTAQSGDGQITLSWTAVADADSGSSSIAGYDIRYRRPRRPGMWHTVSRRDAAAATETVTGLINGTVYGFEVRAVNSESFSEWVSVGPVFPTDHIPPDGAPDAPSNLVAAPGDANMTVSWAAPTDIGDSAITGYEVRYRRAASSATAWTTHDSSIAGRATVIDGLINIQPYDVQVRAANDEGSGPWVTATAGALSMVEAGNEEPAGMWADGSILYIGDGDDTKAYAYRLATGARAPGSDIDLTGGNTQISGFWGDDDTLYVLDAYDDQIYAYDRSTGGRDPDLDYVGVGPPPSDRGRFDTWVLDDIYSDGETMWVLDFWNDKVYAYGAQSRLPQPGLDLEVGASDGLYSAMWSDGETLWLGDTRQYAVHAFNLRTKSRDADLDNTIFADILGMWSDGATMWSLHQDLGYLIDAAPLERRPAPVRSLSAGIGDTEVSLQWSDPDDGLADPTYEVEYREDSPTGAWTAVDRSDTAALAETVTGLTNGTYYRLRVRAVSDSGHAGRWTAATGSPAPAGAPGSPRNLEVDGVTETADEGGADRALSVQWDPPLGSSAATYEARYRADRSTPQPWTTLTVTGTAARIAGLNAGTRYEVQVRAVQAGVAGTWATASNRAGRGFYALLPSPGGIWSDGTIMWVSDSIYPKILAFDMQTKERIPGRDFYGLDEKQIRSASSLWSDGEKMWVVNDTFFTSRRVASYDMETGRYVETVFSEYEYDPPAGSSLLDRAGNAWPNGIWGTGSTLWIADINDKKVYAYDVDTGNRLPRQDFDNLVEPYYEDVESRSQLWPGGMWTDGTTMWVIDEINDRIYAYSMSTKERDPGRDIEFAVDVWLEDVWSSGDGTLWVADDKTRSIIPIVLPDPPGAPRRLSASPGDGSVTVAWDAPARGSSDITGYTVRYFDTDRPGTVSRVSRGDAAALTEEITGLTNGKTYEVEVRAHNSETHSDWESARAVPVGPPGPVRSLDAEGVNAALNVSWRPPSQDGGSTVIGYDVEYRIKDSGDPWTSDSTSVSDTEWTIDGLTNGVDYEIQVRARNDQLDGEWLAIMETPLAVPLAPTAVTAATGDRALAVAWSVPSDDGGSLISGYDVEYRIKDSGDPWTSDRTSVSATVWTIDGLTNGVDYEVQVRARNIRGPGVWSFPGEGRPSTVPGSPRNVRAAPDNNALVVQWDAPDDDGGVALLDYRVRYRTRSPRGDWMVEPDAVTGAPWTIDGLMNGTAYDVSVAARNENDYGPEALANATPAAAPSAPRGVFADPDDRKLAVVWEAPDDDGGGVEDYRVRYRTRSPQGPWRVDSDGVTALSWTIDGLMNGTAYDVSVEARSSAGRGPFATAEGTPSTVPGMPRSLQFSIGVAQLDVEWAAPSSDGGAAIDEYVVQYRETNPAGLWILSGTVAADAPGGLVASIVSLANGTSYDVCVLARNENGDGACAETSAVPAALPGQVRDLEPVPQNRSVKLYWEPPSVTGGVPVSRYDVQYRAATATTWRDAPGTPEQNGTSLTLVVRSLTNGQAYLLQVRAVGPGGKGRWLQVSANPTPPPGSLARLTVTEGPAQLEAEWSPPANSLDSGVSGYELEHRLKAAASDPWTPVTERFEDGLSAPITGLAGGVAHQVRARAVNEGGDAGPWRTTEGVPEHLEGLSVSGTAAYENSGTATVTVTLSGASSRAVTVDYATSDGTAEAGVDYEAATGTVTFANGETARTLTVVMLDDSLEEGAETVEIRLSNASNAAISLQGESATLTILDDETRPSRPVTGGVVGGGGGGGGGGPVEEDPQPSPVSTEFEDVADSNAHFENIAALESMGVFDGTECGEALLCPSDPVERWVMAVWLVRILDGEDPARSETSRFDDVDPAEWWAPYVERLAELGVTVGCATEPLRYCPDVLVSRAQMATFLSRAFGLPAAPQAGFGDVGEGVHAAAIDALYAAGLTVGCSHDPLNFCPGGDTTRAQMSSFLNRALSWEP